MRLRAYCRDCSTRGLRAGVGARVLSAGRLPTTRPACDTCFVSALIGERIAFKEEALSPHGEVLSVIGLSMSSIARAVKATAARISAKVR